MPDDLVIARWPEQMDWSKQLFLRAVMSNKSVRRSEDLQQFMQEYQAMGATSKKVFVENPIEGGWALWAYFALPTNCGPELAALLHAAFYAGAQAQKELREPKDEDKEN